MVTKKLICERCGEPGYAIYNPHLTSYPQRIILCQDCGGKDGKATIVERLNKENKEMPVKKVESVEVEPEVTKSEEQPVEVPQVEPTPKPDDAAATMTKEQVWEKIKIHEAELQKLINAAEELKQKHNQTVEMIVVRRGAIAGLKELIGAK